MAARWTCCVPHQPASAARGGVSGNTATHRQADFHTGMPPADSFPHNPLAQDPWFAPYAETLHPCRGEAAKFRAAENGGSYAPVSPGWRPNWRTSPMSRITQECSEISAHVFRSRRFETTHRLPHYRTWLDRSGDLSAYRFHKRFLQHLQHRRGPGRWIVKCPEHTFSLD
jgi:hypothetical protein